MRAGRFAAIHRSGEWILIGSLRLSFARVDAPIEPFPVDRFSIGELFAFPLEPGQ
jgi:hypothetical protein